MSITIKKFRSIEYAKINLNEIASIVGQNSAGKSAILLALKVFFHFDSERENHLLGKHSYTNRTHSKIELTFFDLPNDQKITNHARNDLLSLQLTLRPGVAQPTVHATTSSNARVGYEFVTTLKRHFRFILIPALRNPTELKWHEETLLRKTVEATLEKKTSNRDTLSRRFNEATNFLERNALKPIADRLHEFYSISHDFEFHLTYAHDVTYRDFLSRISFGINESDLPFDIEQQGTGVQSLAVIALHQLLASLENTSILIGIEEPETNLHPQAQKELIKNLRNSFQSTNNAQIIFTTHSPVIVDQLQHDEIVLVRKTADSSRGFKTSANQLPSDFLTKYNIAEEKYYKFHSFKNSEFFFASLVIAVEGDTDAQVVRYLLESTNADPNLFGISIVVLDGSLNLPYLRCLLSELEIPNYIVLDKDHFLPYFDAKLSSSRSASGTPKYQYAFKPDSFINFIIPEANKQTQLLREFRRSHSKSLNILEQYGVICMRFCLEIDLVESNTARNIFFNDLGVPIQNQTKLNLLTNYKQAIKRRHNILNVVKNTPHQNLPYSYRRIKKVVRDFIS